MAKMTLKVLIGLASVFAWLFALATVMGVAGAMILCIVKPDSTHRIMGMSAGGVVKSSWALTYAGWPGALLALAQVIAVVGALWASLSHKTPHRHIGHVILILWAALWTFNAFRVFPDGDFNLIYMMPLFLLCTCIRAVANLTQNSASSRCYILDTNIFNRILDDQIDLGQMRSSAKLFATHVQRNELQNTADAKRRQRLLKVFEAIGPEQIPTESAVWDVSEWGSAKWTAEDNLYQPILRALDAKKRKRNNMHDSLIAETAILNNLTLVTEDRNLTDVARDQGGSVIDLASFMHALSK